MATKAITTQPAFVLEEEEVRSSEVTAREPSHNWLQKGAVKPRGYEGGLVQVKNDLAVHDGHRPEFIILETQEPAHAGTKIVRNLLQSFEEKGVRYCHWKSNVRLKETLAGTQDIDILVDRGHAGLFHATLLENGFKLAQSRSGAGHPGVFHALGLDGATTELVDLHAYHQIVSGDSLVKNYRLPVEDRLLARTCHLHGVKVPTPEAELVLFALRIALKH